MSRAWAVGNVSSGPAGVRRGFSRAFGCVLALCLVGGVVSLGAPVLASAEGCTNAAFRVGPSAHLPDCRAYEQVTPVYKDSGSVSVAGPGLGTAGVQCEPAGNDTGHDLPTTGWSRRRRFRDRLRAGCDVRDTGGSGALLVAPAGTPLSSAPPFPEPRVPVVSVARSAAAARSHGAARAGASGSAAKKRDGGVSAAGRPVELPWLVVSWRGEGWAMSVRRAISAGVLVFVVFCAVVVFSASSAFAEPTLIGSFGSATSTLAVDPEPLSEPTRLAVNQSSGDVYVIDAGDRPGGEVHRGRRIPLKVRWERHPSRFVRARRRQLLHWSVCGDRGGQLHERVGSVGRRRVRSR